MSWASHARFVIGRVHQALPADATLAQRKAALRKAYPFGPRAYSPYKSWLKAQRAYLARYAEKPANPGDAGPLFKAEGQS